VVEIAVTTAWEPFAFRSPGITWVTRADAGRLVSGLPDRSAVLSTVALRLADPTNAPAFVAARSVDHPPGPMVESWQKIRDDVTSDSQRVRTVLLTGSTLLALLALVSVAVLVVGRLANQTRRVGLLKAVAATPRLVAAVLLAEHLLLALVAAAIGLAGGWLGAPLLARPATGVLG
jgi:putative ABC transport system permease protein